MKLPLNEQQRRHLAVVLDRVDDALLQVVASAAPDPFAPAPERFLRPLVHDLPAAVAATVRAAALASRARLGDDIARLGIEPRPDSARRRASAYLTAALVLLEDCHAASMTAYGEVDPRLARVLDPWLATLERDVSGLHQLLLRAERDDGSTG